MSAEDCILYRKIGDEWFVLGYGFTFSESELNDCDFKKSSEVVPFSDLFRHLAELDAKHVTEHGICYSGEFVSDPPPEVPKEHRMLCCMPDECGYVEPWSSPCDMQGRCDKHDDRKCWNCGAKAVRGCTGEGYFGLCGEYECEEHPHRQTH